MLNGFTLLKIPYFIWANYPKLTDFLQLILRGAVSISHRISLPGNPPRLKRVLHVHSSLMSGVALNTSRRLIPG
jgi:hypothetical protein